MVTIQNTQTVACKYCGLSSTVKCGSYRGIQRYWCKICNKKFKADAHLFHMKVSCDIVSDTLDFYYSGVAIGDVRSHLRDVYHCCPIRSVIHLWIEKYTSAAINLLTCYSPVVRDAWLAWETGLKIGDQHGWIYYVIDEGTHFILASLIDLPHDMRNSNKLLRMASAKAGKIPGSIKTFMRNPNSVEQVFGCETINLHMDPRVELSNTGIWDYLPREQELIMDRLHSLDKARQILAGWIIHHNYFRKDSLLEGRTPAAAAGIIPPVKSWKNLIMLRQDLSSVVPGRHQDITSHEPHG